jgi:hypothetical protein
LTVLYIRLFFVHSSFLSLTVLCSLQFFLSWRYYDNRPNNCHYDKEPKNYHGFIWKIIMTPS